MQVNAGLASGPPNDSALKLLRSRIRTAAHIDVTKAQADAGVESRPELIVKPIHRGPFPIALKLLGRLIGLAQPQVDRYFAIKPARRAQRRRGRCLLGLDAAGLDLWLGGGR